MKAEQGEVVAQLHCLDGVLLLFGEKNTEKQENVVNLSTVRTQTQGGRSEYLLLLRQTARKTTITMRNCSHMSKPAELQRKLHGSGVRGCKTLANMLLKQ